MEDSSTSDCASPDVRPVICESLLDLSDWVDLLDERSQGSGAEDKPGSGRAHQGCQQQDDHEPGANSSQSTKSQPSLLAQTGANDDVKSSKKLLVYAKPYM
ncbi:uncharacterized protein [Diadema setosum]|uniref:uncharacterized protein n=1 Tax=Diadema setosum TaxID=31175 RepID=UPI003B3AA0FE